MSCIPQTGADQSQLLPFISDHRIHDWSDRLTTFSDTAFLVNQLDLVISVDTAVAHLSGALSNLLDYFCPNSPIFVG